MAKHVSQYCTDSDLALHLQAQAIPWLSKHVVWQVAPEPYTPVLHDLVWAVMRLHWLLSHADLFLTARMLVLFMPFSRVNAGPCGI